jgi:hypothetical protein
MGHAKKLRNNMSRSSVTLRLFQAASEIKAKDVFKQAWLKSVLKTLTIM